MLLQRCLDNIDKRLNELSSILSFVIGDGRRFVHLFVSLRMTINNLSAIRN